MRRRSPDLSVLADRDCLVTFAAMALCCDNSVRDHEMGYHQGGGTAYITAKGVMRRTGLRRAAADRALQLHGGMGYSEEYHVSRYFRESRLMKIAPVSQEMILNFLVEHVLGLPRSY